LTLFTTLFIIPSAWHSGLELNHIIQKNTGKAKSASTYNYVYDFLISKTSIMVLSKINKSNMVIWFVRFKKMFTAMQAEQLEQRLLGYKTLLLI